MRDEISVTEQHAAYTELLSAADELVLHRYVHWHRISAATGPNEQATNSTLMSEYEERGEAEREREKERNLADASNKLRLAIDSEDAPLIDKLNESLGIHPYRERWGYTPGLEPKYWTRPEERLLKCKAIKLSVVNDFRTDVLGEEPLPEEMFGWAQWEMDSIEAEIHAAEVLHQQRCLNKDSADYCGP